MLGLVATAAFALGAGVTSSSACDGARRSFSRARRDDRRRGSASARGLRRRSASSCRLRIGHLGVVAELGVCRAGGRDVYARVRLRPRRARLECSGGIAAHDVTRMSTNSQVSWRRLPDRDHRCWWAIPSGRFWRARSVHDDPATSGLVLLDLPSQWHESRGRGARTLGWHPAGPHRRCPGAIRGGAGVPLAAHRRRAWSSAQLRAGFRAYRRADAGATVGSEEAAWDAYPSFRCSGLTPKSFRALGDHLRAVEENRCVRRTDRRASRGPLVIISSSIQPSTVIEQAWAACRTVTRGRHVIAANAGHWVHTQRARSRRRDDCQVAEETRTNAARQPVDPQAR